MPFKSKIISFPFAGILGTYLLGIYANWMPVWGAVILLVLGLISLLQWRNIYIATFIILMLLGFTQTKIRLSEMDINYKTASSLNESEVLINGSVKRNCKSRKWTADTIRKHHTPIGYIGNKISLHFTIY